MSTIHLQRKHKVGLKKAKAAAQKIADEMNDVFDMASEWDGNTLHFSRTGVQGTLTVSRDAVKLQAKLGLLLAALKPRIEAQIEKNFDKYFG